MAALALQWLSSRSAHAMTTSSSIHPYGAAIAVGAAGIIMACLSGEVAGLLAVLAAVYICRHKLPTVLAIGVCSLALALFLFVPGFDLSPVIRICLRFAALLAAVSAIGLLIQDNRGATSTDHVTRPTRELNSRVSGWEGTTRSLDDQKTIEGSLRGRAGQPRLLIDAIPALVWCATPDGEPSFFNKRLIDFTGITLDSCAGLKGQTLGVLASRAIVHADEMAELERLWAQSVQTGGALSMRHRLRRVDGVYRWVDLRAEPLRNDDGEIIQWYGVCVDVDDRQKAEEALRRRELQLRLLIDAIPALVWCATPDGEPSYFNKRLIDFTGITLDGVEGLKGDTLGSIARRAIVHLDELAELERLWAQSVQTGGALSMRHRLRRADGVYRWVDLRAEPLRNDDGDIIEWYGVLVDIEEENRIQEALRETQDKLSRASQAASLAELSASIAHEVNQPLAAMVANSHACQRWLSAEPPNLERARVIVERIIRDANSAAEVVSKIRALFKQTAPARISLNLNEVITEVCQLIGENAARKNINIETDLDRHLPPVLVDRVQMQQVLVNLIRNGIDAMESTTDYSKSLLIRSRRDDMNAVLVEVRDRGHGVADPERIFEPFYTTKHNGMGMGLAICRSIIEAHDGRLRVTQNEPGGTTLTFTLPTCARDHR
jgi:PAS domain S-box-containing protein